MTPFERDDLVMRIALKLRVAHDCLDRAFDQLEGLRGNAADAYYVSNQVTQAADHIACIQRFVGELQQDTDETRGFSAGRAVQGRAR